MPPRAVSDNPRTNASGTATARAAALEVHVAIGRPAPALKAAIPDNKAAPGTCLLPAMTARLRERFCHLPLALAEASCATLLR